MKLFRILHDTRLPDTSTGRIITLGSFDGLHLGHQKVVKEVVQLAKKTGLTSGLLTFYPHPSVRVGRAKKIPQLTTLRQRVAILSRMGVEELYLFNFSSRARSMEWQEFCKKVLIEQMGVKVLILGADARIGQGAKGTPELIAEYMTSLNIDVRILELDNDIEGVKYSSRHIRDDVSSGNLLAAEQSLGRPFSIWGKVVHGKKNGRTLGFPTANIYAPKTIMLPTGVYAVKMQIQGGDDKYAGVMNIGYRPTLTKKASPPSLTTEVHLFDFDKDIYGKEVAVEVIARIREEQKFNSLEELKEQITKDCSVARKILGWEFFVLEDASLRLDKFLTEAFRKENIPMTRSRVEKLIEQGDVQIEPTVNVKPGLICKKGWKILVKYEAEPLRDNVLHNENIEAQDITFEILYEDKDILAVNKHANFIVHPGAGNKKDTLLNAVKFYLTAKTDLESSQIPARLGLVHRLDKDTTGVILFAKSTATLADISRQFSDRKVNKQYMALVYLPTKGKHLFRDYDEGTIDTPIGRDPKNRLKMTTLASGKKAVTEWKVLERFPQAALLLITLHTGRTHQIRVHMESVGSAVLGDVVYGNLSQVLTDRTKEILRKANHQLLHAFKIECTHPRTKERMHIEAPLPLEFEQAIEAFRNV